MKRLIALLLCLLLLCPTLAACGAHRVAEESFFALDTVVTVRVIGKDAKKALAAVKDAVTVAQIRFSAYEGDSEVTKINENAGQWTTVSPATLAQLKIAKELQEALPDTFSPFLLELSVLWDFGSQRTEPPAPEQISALLAKTEGAVIEIDEAQSAVRIPADTKIDLGGIAKGAIGKELCEVLSRYRLTGAYLSLGGNVQLYKAKADDTPWRIALADPFAPAEVLGVLQTEAAAIVTSGGYQRYITSPDGTRYHHILDPKTGYPADTGLASVTVICEDGAWADALSTALFVAGYARTVEYWQTSTVPFEFVLVQEDGTVLLSEGIAQSFTLSSSDAKIETVLRK